jgi:replicative DNA helicase
MNDDEKNTKRIETENHLLSCVLLDEDNIVFNTCLSHGIETKMFTGKNALIWDGMLALWTDDQPIEPIAVALKCNAIPQDLLLIQNLRDTASNYKFFLDEMLRWDMRDRLSRLSMFINDSEDDEPEEVYCKAIQMLEERPDVSEETYQASATTEGLLERVQAERKAGANIVTGIDSLDKYLIIRKTQLITIAARPSCGKSALGGQVAYNAAVQQKKKVAFFTLEMTKDELMLRGVAMLSGVGTERIECDKMTDADRDKVDTAVRRIGNSDLYMFESAGATVENIIGRCKQLKAKHGLDLIVIDYLQLIKPTDSKLPKHEQLGHMTSSLKRASMSLQCPIIQLAQINRDAAKANRRPVQSDLKGSGNIEEDSDVVLFIHPENVEDANEITPVDLIIEKLSVKVDFNKIRSFFKQKPITI